MLYTPEIAEIYYVNGTKWESGGVFKKKQNKFVTCIMEIPAAVAA